MTIKTVQRYIFLYYVIKLIIITFIIFINNFLVGKILLTIFAVFNGSIGHYFLINEGV